MQTIDLRRIPEHLWGGKKSVRQPAWAEQTDTVTVRVDQIAGIFPGVGLSTWEPKEQKFFSMMPDGDYKPIPGWERGTWCDVAMLDGTRIYVRESFDSLRSRWLAALGKPPIMYCDRCGTPLTSDGWCSSCRRTRGGILHATPPPAATPPAGFVLIYDGEWKKDTKPSDIMMAAAKASPQSRFRHILDGSQLKVWREFTPPPAATPPPPTPAAPDQAPPPAHPTTHTPDPS